MRDRPGILLATTIGATLGAVAGFLFFTDQGRSLLGDLEPALEDVSRELSRFRQTMKRAAGVASEGWQLLNDAMGEGAPGASPRYADPHQTTPF